MAFSWKDKKDIWKGEGIYFLTFNVRNRACLLGTLRRLPVPDSDGHIAAVDDTMGKARLLDYPDKHVVAISRSLTPEQIATEVRKALWLAESGAVTYCAAINDAEKAVTKAIRSAGYPLVVMMLDGFPPEGTDAARYFHPNGVYHQSCGLGLLYLIAPSPSNYNDPRVIELTDRELARKAAAKHLPYTPIPHTSKRWRMIAINIMLTMV